MNRVAFVIATLTQGGAERAVSNIVTHLPKNYEIDIILNDDESISYPYKGNIVSLGMKPKKNKVNIIYQAQVFIKRILVLRRLKKDRKYDAVISFSDSASVANILSGNKYSKTIASVRINLSKSSDSWAYKYIINPLARMLYNKADMVVAVSKGVEKDLIENFGLLREKVTTITNGYDSSVIKNKMNQDISAEEENWLEADFVISTMGRLEDQKGQWHLIRALSVLKKENLKIKLLILGDGQLKTYLKQLVDELDLEDNIVFGGFSDNPFSVLEKTDLYVFPSLFEGFPNALAEAMCCGLPCISADFDSGAREILAPSTDVSYKNMDEIEYAEYGVLVPVCDGKKYNADEPLTKEELLLAEAIRSMIDNEALYKKYREKIKIRVAELDINETVKQWQNVIE